jgi:HEAT repeat protein
VTRLWFATCACLLAASAASAQANIQNARLQERPAGDLSQTFLQLVRETGPLWIAYAVPAHSPEWNACCDGDGARRCCSGCSLDERRTDTATVDTRRAARPVQLEGSASAVVLYRIENGRVGKVRTFSASCELDAGGRPVYWLTGANPAASVALLKRLLFSPGTDAPDDTVPRHLVSEVLFAVSVHQAPEGVTTLIDLARNAPQSRVRSDALFWLAQRAGEKAAGTITDAITNDPDTKVKERAVFALSQLPGDEGVPKLIEVARTNRNPRVRQQAVFWLGQSKDPRALTFFEEILR